MKHIHQVDSMKVVGCQDGSRLSDIRGRVVGADEAGLLCQHCTTVLCKYWKMNNSFGGSLRAINKDVLRAPRI